LAVLSESTSHDAVRLGAIKGRADTVRAKLGLMATVGVLPRDLGRLRFEVDVRRFAETVLDAFSRHDVPHNVQEAVVKGSSRLPPQAAQRACQQARTVRVHDLQGFEGRGVRITDAANGPGQNFSTTVTDIGL